MKWTGKSSLTLKWANPLIDLGKIEGTKIERYERTVSQVVGKDLTTEHVFEIGDWGGEHIVDAQQELIVDEIHGMLIVVDLGGKDGKTVEHRARAGCSSGSSSPRRSSSSSAPRRWLRARRWCSSSTRPTSSPARPAEAEAQAKLYAKLIDDLKAQYQAQVDIRVLVGSANYGHSTHLLFSHFVEKILPRNAYDNQLLQRMKDDLAARPARPPSPARTG